MAESEGATHVKASRKLALFAMGIAVAVTASAKASPRQNSNSSSHTSTADLGSVSGNVYTNDSIGVTYEFPKGWFVDRSWIDAQNKPTDLGPRPSDPGEAAKYDSMAAMKKGTHALLAVSEHGGDTASDTGPRIQLSVSPVFENRSGSDILSGMKAAYGRMRLIQVVDDPLDYTFGGMTFSRMDLRLLDVILKGGAGFQSAIIGTRKGQYLQFLILADSPEQLDSLVHSLDSLKFK